MKRNIISRKNENLAKTSRSESSENINSLKDSVSNSSNDSYQMELSDSSIFTFQKVVTSKICYTPSFLWEKKKDNIPFHLPHKKLLHKIESIRNTPELLAEFTTDEETIKENVTKPFIQESNVEEKNSEYSYRVQEHSKGECLKNKPIVADLLELIRQLKSDPNVGFYYMIYAVEPFSKFFSPYALKVVPYKEIGKVYMTISANGVTQYCPPDITFTPIDMWEREYNDYLKLIQIKSFSLFPLRKAFYTWRKIIIDKKVSKAKNYLKNNLFIIDPILSKTLLNVKAMCATFWHTSLIDIRIIEKLALFQFVEIQFTKLEEERQKLDIFRNQTVDIVKNSCVDALLAAGYIVNDSNSSNKLAPKGNAVKMSHIEQAIKKEKCEHLCRFIRLIDYLHANMMHELLHHTYEELLIVLRKHIQFILPEEKFDDDHLDLILENKRPSSCPVQYPYFIVDLIISLESGISMDPSDDIIRYVFTEIQLQWEKNFKEIEPLLCDSSFHPFTWSMTNIKTRRYICGDLPEISAILNEDTKLSELKQQVDEIIKQNALAVKKYCKRFANIQLFYAEDVQFDENVIRENERCDLFREWCARYQEEENIIRMIVERQPLGIFYLQLERFKTVVLPVIHQKQQILKTVMLEIGKRRVNFLLTEAITAVNYLETEPITTDDYVSYIKFVDHSPRKVELIEEELCYVTELYDIMGEYDIPVSVEDVANYAGIGIHFTNLKSLVTTKVEERDKLMFQFNLQIQKDIDNLVKKIEIINDEAKQPWLTDSNSNMDFCLETLNDLSQNLAECVKIADEYRAHQKGFKVEMTRFDILEQAISEVKMRTLLLESSGSWNETVENLYCMNFELIDVEDLTSRMTSNIKSIALLEKNLPPNNILPSFKVNVDRIKVKLPIIGYLRNPNLRPRHWQKIENLLKHKFKPDEPIILSLLDSLGIFECDEELKEISAAASSEAGLESMLKKVEDTWQSLEFIILPHKESKDVYILGSLEEIQTALDDSNIAVQTIAASRHIDPIKPRVEEWIRLLDIFAKTLEAWQYCQQQWLYLEAIFSAPGIQRKLPVESNLFASVDKSWKEIMRKTTKVPLAMQTCTQSGLLEQLTDNNEKLDQIMKCLEAYLETKRITFPRFFFLSNDELIEILAQTRNPHAVQRHLQKCFDAIYSLEFATEESIEGSHEILTTDIIAMISPEGERVALGKGLKARGNVEDWLSKVEYAMFASLRKQMKAAINDFSNRGRQEFLWSHPAQIVLTVSQIFWTRNVHLILDSENVEQSMQLFEQQLYSDLNILASMVRGELPKLIRDIIINLITIDVHARDIVTALVEKNIASSTNFEWTKSLRYYWDTETDNCFAKMSNAEYVYGYEYLGNQRRLVITPLTDKCYLCLMGAFQLNLGGAPAGPAGTGKTETTKDLAKALAIQCVVFNCSEGLDYKMMGRFFSGLVTSGAWCCFDEFNRIDIEVLSVIAQQLITIRNAKVARKKELLFEGRKIKLVMSCSAFITMNPGYAGRTELPDNLKSLFRPFAMMVPDYELISEVILYSEGFESSKALSKKMTLMYKLCSEQLSQQDHYDFGMRAVKSVLVMAGSLKRDHPDEQEDVVLIRALRDSNLPKFLANDAELFHGILRDLFPGVHIPNEDYGIFQQTAVKVLTEAGLQPENCSVKKVIQLHETMRVRHGVMLVGPTGSGKSTVLRTLRDTYTQLHKKGIQGQYYQTVYMYIINPKAVTIGELYGEVDTLTNEWHDGLLGVIVRHACSFTTEEHQWIVCDGPVDAVWIENMNTVLDDNKMLCLANSERIKFTPYVHMIFEVMDLAQASPATVSRCGMVYVDSAELKWLPYVKSWLQNLPDKIINNELRSYLLELFEKYVDDGLTFFKKNCDCTIAQVDIGKANTLCALIESILMEFSTTNKNLETPEAKTCIVQSFIFSYIWAIGGNASDTSLKPFELYVKKQFDGNLDTRLHLVNDLWNVYTNVEKCELELWEKIMPDFVYNQELPFFEIMVPTMDTVRFTYIMQKLVNNKKPILLTGNTGVGKSIIAKTVLANLQKLGTWVPVELNFSAQTSSSRTQEILELKLERKKRALLGAPVGKRVCVFVDDVNMPKLDKYGSQPAIELLRQFLDFGGLYDREKLFWKDIEDVILTCACGPPGGGRNPVTQRFIRHFSVLLIPVPSENSLTSIFSSIMQGFLQEFSHSIINIGDKIVTATIEVYIRIAVDLLPTPEKSHYVFNLRDLSKCIQGMLQADSSIVTEAKQMMKLFYHECLRVFHDRLINVEDKSYFYHLMSEISLRTFGDEVLPLSNEKIITQPPVLLFGDFMGGVVTQQRVYEEITNIKKVRTILQDYLEDYCITKSKDMNLIFFMDAIEHLCRLARILRSERGNGLLVGVGGMGKQSLTKLASHVNGYRCMQIEVSRGYDKNNWYEDLRRFYFEPGAYAKPTTFLFTDTQIVTEEFLEDINNILNSGEIPNLFEADELEKVIIATRPAAKEADIVETSRDAIYQFFIGRVRNNLHLMLCMSPVGHTFRRRCRMFPSLVNCCTIDWFSKWPNEALLSVAEKSISPIINDDKKSSTLASICVLIHESVTEMTIRYFNEMRRRYYTTPSSYLELLKLYLSTLKRKKQEILLLKDKITNGLNKLQETNELIGVMKEQLIVLAPKLKITSEEVSKLMKIIEKEQVEIDKVRSVVAADEAIAKIKAAETGALEAEARQDLEAAMPALEEAQKALAAINKNDINEIKVFNKPPHLVRFVMEAVNLLLNEKTNWPTAKLVLSDIHFLDRLINYSKDDVSDKLLKKLQNYVTHPDFEPDKVSKQSKVCKSICIWVRAIDGYARMFRIVQPKRLKLQEAEKELSAIENILKQKQYQLAEIEDKVKTLQKQYNTAVKNLNDLEYKMELSEARLNRSDRLTSALQDEEIRWKTMTKEFDKQIENVVGDSLVAAGELAYLGAFTSTYREELLRIWLNRCKEQGIETTPNFNLITMLADPYEIRLWNTYDLPRDKVSTENAIMVTQAGRWPLMIDPQEQANRWIRNMEQENGLKICKMTDSNFIRHLEVCISTGAPFLLQEVGETLDPGIETILLKQTFIQGGRTMIRLGDNDIEYDMHFRLYITTKLANPHYLPEVCIKVTTVNFTVTSSGLEEQLLADVVRLERPDLEIARNELIAKINEDKNQLQNIENKILTLLFTSGDNILDNEELVETLNESKETSDIIATRLKATEKTEEKISVAREKYRIVANRGSVLYFVVANLANIDPMYQFSLKYFNQIFNHVIETSEKDNILEKRLKILLKETTAAIYRNVSRGLFEKHKLIYSFMLNIAIFLDAKMITYAQWDFLLRGPGQIKTKTKKPDLSAVTDLMWESINYLVSHFNQFKQLVTDAFKKIRLNIEYYEEEINVLTDNNEVAATSWNDILDDMDKLMLLKTLKEETIVFGITAYVKKNLGQKFIESPMISLKHVFPDTSKTTPLIFILSTGSDPFSAFQKFAAEMGFSNRVVSISLGQGQGPIAENLVKKSKREGNWVFLQNCHLATSWMLAMESMVIQISEESSTVHEDFRLFLSSMPSASFPVSVLQNSVKVTNEPSKGLKANVKRSLFDMEEDFFENHPLDEIWRRMIFGICFFHAIIQERKKFGPLGWNILYEFNENDRECCLLNLKMFCGNRTIAWDAIIYITGEIIYGGRITDNWDQRCLKTILTRFLSPKTLKTDYTYSTSKMYYCPVYQKLEEYRNFVECFPIIEDPDIFGMHENANIIYKLKETRTIMNTIMEVYPRISVGDAEQSNSEIAHNLADMVIKKICLKIESDNCHPDHLKKDNTGRIQSLTIVLMHEIDRYNKLLRVIHSSMENLKKAIKGLIVMSDELEKVFTALVNNQVPEMWHNVNIYPSLKSLGTWIRDLELRIDFIEAWLTKSQPTSFWISGLSFPQGFITGMLQAYSRKYDIPIDYLKMDFICKSTILDQEEIEIMHKKNKIEVPEMYKNLDTPQDGILIHGLYIDAGKWDFNSMTLVDAKKGEINAPLPVLHILPVLSLPKEDPRYICPLYKTSIRAGVLSTTGHSTNFVIPILLPSMYEQSYWILKGTALLIQITD